MQVEAQRSPLGYYDREFVEHVYTERGNKSAAIIAGECGLSRNAIIGLWYRERLRRGDGPLFTRPRLNNRQPAKSRSAPRPRQPVTFKRAHAKARRPVASDEPAGPGIPFDMLEPHHCRYAVNDDHPFLFCGEVKKDDSSYCPFHSDLCMEKRQ